jgi:hypothetical protein
MITHEELRERLHTEGVVLLRNSFACELLVRLREAAARCFAWIESGKPVPDRYRFTAQAHSVGLAALLDFGIGNDKELAAPLEALGLDAMYPGWRCRLEHCWVRKKFAPRNTVSKSYQIQDWHQDGALGIQFPLAPGPVGPATELVTYWIPLDACGRDSPGLEFIRTPQPGLLHFTELNDAALRRRFDPARFWAPELEVGDGLVFRNDVLHRTHRTEQMTKDRISVEYRIFPG